MFSWPWLLMTAGLALLVGVLLALSFLPRDWRWSLPAGFAALTLAVVVTGWVALVLAEMGLLGRLPLLVALAILAGALLVWRAARGRDIAPAGPTVSPDRLAKWEWLMLALWGVAALWLFFRPHEYIQGGADAGVYVSLGAELAQHGGFRIEDETLAALDPALKAAVLRPLPNTPGASAYLLPGFYVTDAAAGRVTPQFYPFHPVWQAMAYGAAGGGPSGMRAELLLTGLWAMMGTLAVYLAAREVSGPVAGALTLAGLTLSGLQVWFARYPSSEALTQFLLWAGVWSASRWLGEHRPPALWAFTAGSAFGAVFLVRIDTLVLLPVFTLVLVWRWARGWRRGDTWFAAPFFLLVAHSLLHGHFLSAPYFYETVGYGLSLLLRVWPLLIVGTVLAALVLWWLPRHPERLRAPATLTPLALAALALLLLAYALYGWFLRPELGTTTLRPDVFSGGEIPVTNHENWRRLGWYLTPLGVWLGVLGGCWLVWRVDRRTILLVALGWLFSSLYLWNVSANPHHVYVMRRYVPAVLPFFILSGAHLLGHHRFGREQQGAPERLPVRLPYPVLPVITAVLAALWLGGIGWAARGLVSQVDHAGLTAQLAALAAKLPPGAVLLFNDQSPVGQGDVWGTPLKFVYDHDLFSLRLPPSEIAGPLAKTIRTWQNSGRQVVWIGDPGWLDGQRFTYRREEITLSTTRLESSYESRPRAIVPAMTSLALNYLEAN